ncbi:MAG: TonB-dependent receptor, partial [Rhodospirillaceae bacterium]|nr:TonB-dependent receptor [Rhodospirillaceae bacterium]
SLLPAGLIDHIEVTRGLAPIEYGPNAVAGAIDLVTHIPQEETSLRAELQGGSLGLSNINAIVGLDPDNQWSFVAAGSTIDRDAERIADKQSIAFDPSTDRARTNTDMASESLFAAAAYTGDAYFLRASLLHATAERGIAAQGDLNPATGALNPAAVSPRFWRMPERNLTQATLNGNWNLREGVGLRLTGWQQRFDQTIDAYRGYSYTALRERERGRDHTTGARLALSTIVDRATLRFVATVQDSTHRQTDSATATGQAADFVEEPELRYRQRLLTAGLESDLRLSDTLTSTVGLAIDQASTPLTGDKPAQESLSATGWAAGLRWTPSDSLSAVATLGQRSRFPTPRELFGVALGRFALNPDLQPERSLLADFGVQYNPSEALSLDFTLWANDSADTLSQRVVTMGNSSRRQRFNMNGSLSYGIEGAAAVALSGNLGASLSVGLQDEQLARDESGPLRNLLHRPGEQLNLALDWQATSSLDIRAELSYVGQAYDLGDDGADIHLPSSTSFALRGVMTIGRTHDRDIHLTAAVDNLTDALILPQSGLPAPGRSFHVGIRID